MKDFIYLGHVPETIYYNGKPLFDCTEDELREAMWNEHLDKLCDVETMNKAEMIHFIEAWFKVKR